MGVAKRGGGDKGVGANVREHIIRIVDSVYSRVRSL